MKTNRQKHQSSRKKKINAKPTQTTQFTDQNPKLRELIGLDRLFQINLICKQTLKIASVSKQVQEYGQSNKKQFGSKTIRKIQGNSLKQQYLQRDKSKPNKILEQCLQKYQKGGSRQIIFNGLIFNNKKPSTIQNRAKQKDLNIDYLCYGSSKTNKLGLKDGNKVKFDNKQNKNYIARQNEFSIYKFQKPIHGKDINPLQTMFTVKQIQDSHQSLKYCNQSFQESDIKIKNKINVLDEERQGKNLNQMKTAVIIQQNYPCKLSFEKPIEVKPDPHESATLQEQGQILQNIDLNVFKKSIKNNQPSINPKFSFAQALKKGLMQESGFNMKDKSLSLKLGIFQSQQNNLDERKSFKTKNVQLSEMSSIISNAKDSQRNQIQNESIKAQLENINSCFHKKEGNIEKINLGALAAEYEQNFINNDNIQITELPSKSENNTEYVVRYNLRMLQKKNTKTEVIRISPMRFRKKEQVVQELMKNKIVERESNSIIIN